MNGLRRVLRRNDGAAAVELALLLPLLVMLAYGIIEFGVAFGQDLGLGNGAREGARYGATTSSITCDDLIDFTRDAANTSLLDPTDADVVVRVGDDASAAPSCANGPNVATVSSSDPPCEASDGDDRIFVEATYQRGLFIPFGPSNSAFTVNGTGVFRCEY